jgi:hypothetical protein
MPSITNIEVRENERIIKFYDDDKYFSLQNEKKYTINSKTYTASVNLVIEDTDQQLHIILTNDANPEDKIIFLARGGGNKYKESQDNLIYSINATMRYGTPDNVAFGKFILNELNKPQSESQTDDVWIETENDHIKSWMNKKKGTVESKKPKTGWIEKTFWTNAATNEKTYNEPKSGGKNKTKRKINIKKRSRRRR